MFCPKCGTQIPENDYYCPTCGEPVAGRKAPSESDHTAMFDPEDVKRTRVLAALCYVSLLFVIIGLLIEPNSKFIRYHINQSFVLYIFGILAGLVAIIPFLGWIAAAVASVMVIVFMIMGIVNACKGYAKDLPLIGKYTIVYYD
ncbi:MAG: zinc-ribbon domain-containing protein [Oscillospiraceae bacterium]|nr:zinc-ribbon domain-containing protein [Oscillospiraceae bacterium]